MKFSQKTLRPRLPQEAREKLARGGRQQDRKNDYSRRPKHKNHDKYFQEDVS